MPDIDGNSGDDTVEVINDVGTLNGNAAGTPIDNISTRPGDDTITVTDSTISGVVQSVGGEDVITISGSTVSEVSAGSDNDTVTIQGSNIADIRLGVGIPCFTRNTLIETTQGRCCIQELRVGDLIPTATHGIQKIRWIGSRRLEVSDLAGNAKWYFCGYRCC